MIPIFFVTFPFFFCHSNLFHNYQGKMFIHIGMIKQNRVYQMVYKMENTLLTPVNVNFFSFPVYSQMPTLGVSVPVP